MKSWRNIGLIATIIILSVIPLSILKKIRNVGSKDVMVQFVGAAQCMECHINEYNSWTESHHYHAMSVATDSTVLGDFNNVEYNDGFNTHRFFRKNNKFFVNTVGPDGNLTDFEITHTFGYTPLQQYLIPFERGKYQCLHLAWDTEKNKWFNMSAMVYNEDIHHTDWLHWTNQGQNWNGMCAECHSTNLKKNYFHELDSFHTSYSEINVSCEACHGPGSEHIKWARLPEGSRPNNTNFDLKVQTSSINNEQYVDLCARCHSRRGLVQDFSHDFKNIYDYMLPARLGTSYHVDGQILEEDYVWGSFVQSKMYHTDIKCNDCHDIHSGARLFEGNDLCFQCHTQDYYGSARHHFHKNIGESGEPLNIDGKNVAVGEGAQCVNCHMPAQYYMGIDLRNDHSIRIPNPRLTKSLGVPNACNQCHTDQGSDWAIQYFEQWYGKKERTHYGEILAMGRNLAPDGDIELVHLVNDTLYPYIVRATAIDYLGQYSTDTAMQLITSYLDDPSPILRHAAISAYTSNNLEDYLSKIAPLLTDPHRIIRAQAAIKLSIVPEHQIPAHYKEPFQIAINEYRENNEYMADFPSARMNLGILSANTGNPQEAKKHYKKAIEIDDKFEPAKLNLAIIHNQLGENNEAEAIYRRIIEDNPEFSGVYYSLGLLLAEQQKYAEATEYLEIAIERNPENSRVYYNLALIYQQIGDQTKAEARLLKTVELEPENFDFLYALCYFYATTEQYAKARKVGKELKKLYPDHTDSNQLIDYIDKAITR